jgi:hypothetical protein
MAAGSDTSATHIASCLVVFDQQKWVSQALVKSCIELYLPQLFNFLLEHYPALLIRPGDHGEPSIKETLSGCAGQHCFEHHFYDIARKIERKYDVRY